MEAVRETIRFAIATGRLHAASHRRTPRSLITTSTIDTNHLEHK